MSNLRTLDRTENGGISIIQELNIITPKPSENSLSCSEKIGKRPKSLSSLRAAYALGERMDLTTGIELLQALLVLAIFLFILAIGFKVWAWNYVVPPRSR